MNVAATNLTAALREEAERLGFALVGATRAAAPAGLARLDEWLARGYAGEMGYIASRREAYDHPRHVLEGVRSVLMLAFPYRTAEAAMPGIGQGRISRYAWGSDYHDILHDKLRALLAVHEQIAPGGRARGVVDTAPLLERELAQAAGLGWIGKHTLLLNKPAGSYFFLAALLSDQVLDYDEPFTADHCGTCTACLDACPTNAFPEAGVLDATRCISYLTIELKGPIPLELRSGIGDWLFGCDVCQDVCPWNRRATESDEPKLQPAQEMNPVDLIAFLSLDEAAFRARFRHTPLWRAKRRGILRNAAIVLGNQRHAGAETALVHALADAEPLVRGAAAWALGQIATPFARDALIARLAIEADATALDELKRSLKALQETPAVGAPTTAP